jgi:hypothetical protein
MVKSMTIEWAEFIAGIRKLAEIPKDDKWCVVLDPRFTPEEQRKIAAYIEWLATEGDKDD